VEAVVLLTEGGECPPGISDVGPFLEMGLFLEMGPLNSASFAT